MTAQSPLPEAIRQWNPQPMTDAEVEDSARNLEGFVALLLEIDREQSAGSLHRKGAK
jgi:hypothetical protein